MRSLYDMVKSRAFDLICADNKYIDCHSALLTAEDAIDKLVDKLAQMAMDEWHGIGEEPQDEA